jgi:nicotinate-nucleotide adenylyltransferase
MSCWETVTSAVEREALGILGGSFDPIHHGHLRLAEEAIERLGLARVLLIPARPWQRATAASPTQRLAMVELACRGNLRLSADPLEVDRAGPSYTVETLRALRTRYGEHVPLWLVVGADAFLRLPSWHAWEALPTLCHLAVVPRPGVDVERALPAALERWWARRDQAPPAGPAGGLILLDAPELEISATAIRTMLRGGRNPRYLLPDPVLDYIEFEGLYTQEGHGA